MGMINKRINNNKTARLTFATIIAVCLMALWRICDFGNAHSFDFVRETFQGTLPKVNGTHRSAAKVGAREGKAKAKLSKLTETAPHDSPLPHQDEIQAFGENGQLTTQAIENLNLTSDEVQSMTKLVNNIKEQAVADFVNRAKLTENISGENGAFHHTYFAEARADRGREFNDTLAVGCEDLIGAERAQRINLDVSSLDFLGGAGKYDLNIVVFSDGGEKIVKYEMIDPKGGRVIEVRESSYKSFSDTFGDAFSY